MARKLTTILGKILLLQRVACLRGLRGQSSRRPPYLDDTAAGLEVFPGQPA
jgi:hypothetical protein